ncbi:MAG: hypothetical protein ACSHXW_17605 [Yoonia sp.]
MMHLQRRNNMLAFDIFRKLASVALKRETSPIRPARSMSSFSNRSQAVGRDSITANDAVCLFGLGMEDTKTALKVLKSSCITDIQFSASTGCLSGLTCADFQTTYLLVDIDAMGDLEDAVDELIAFRKKCPNVVVVMISAFVLSDDFETYRQLICDATLRSPISQGRLMSGLVSAKHNNSYGMPHIVAAA